MSLKKWFFLFWSTLSIGTAASVTAGLILVWLYSDFQLMELSKPGFNWPTLLFIVLSGSSISVLSHMGFFSYLIVRYIALGFLRSVRLWDILQVVILIVAFFDYIYLRQTAFVERGRLELALPLFLMAAATGIALWKAKLTNRNAFVPTLFFMFVVTVLEAIPALRLEGSSSGIYMIVPLFACNAWQILILHRVLKPQKTSRSLHNKITDARG